MTGFADDFVTIHHGDAWDLAATLEPQSINTIVTSPPYWRLRDYDVEGQFGLEATHEEYIEQLVELFRLLKPALRDDGTVWLNMGDSYAGSKMGRGDTKTDNLGNQHCTTTESRRRDNAIIPRSDYRVEGIKPKDLIGMPWRVAFALQADGWYLRQDIIWSKPNPMPESVTDRCTKAHEYVFLLSKRPHYYYDCDAIRETCESEDPRVQRSSQKIVPKGWMTGEGSHDTLAHNTPDRHPKTSMRSNDAETLGLTRGTTNQPCSNPLGRNKRSVWTVPSAPFSAAHFATFPPDLIKPCILAGCPEGGTVLDPFLGSGTTAQVARSLGRKSVGFELNAEYIAIAAEHRLAQGVLL